MAVNQKRQQASQKKKEKIIHATTKLLLKKGSSTAVSTTDICAVTRITRPTLYHYFGSKRNLLLSVHMESIDSVLMPYLEKADSIIDPLERLTYMIRTYTKDIICVHPELRVFIHDTFTTKDKYFRDVRKVWKRHYLLIKDTITALQSKGEIRSGVRPSWTALFILGMITWITYWFDYTRKDEIDNLSETALQLILKCLNIKDINIQ